MDFPWRVKQRRADEHLRRFADDCAEYVESAHVGFRHDADPEAGTLRVRLHADGPTPPSLGATIGDVLHNLRSALDAVAWEACQRAGTPTDKQQKRIYFPIDTDPDKWPETAEDKLPNVSGPHLEVFERQQPWFWDEEARRLGVNVERSTADSHPLARLHELARIDRHRVPHPVLPLAGDTYLSTPTGVTVRAISRGGRRARPGDAVIEWRVDPPGAVSQVHPGGEPILALSEDAAFHRRSALHELQRMRDAVIEATRHVEIEVLGAVPASDLEGLTGLNRAFVEAETALRALESADHVIDSDYIERHGQAHAAEQGARAAYLERWHELFD